MIKSFLFFIYLFFFYSELSKVVWLSIDSFSGIYINEKDTPTIIELIAKGTSSLKVSPIFPSVTFANHQAQVTGLYAENHGIVNNDIKIPPNTLSGKYLHDFIKSSVERIWWDPTFNMRPIFTANEIANKNHKSSSIFWPGESVNYSNHQISKFEHRYDPSINFEQRIDKAIADLPKYNLINVYVADIDMEAHRYGPYSSEVNTLVKLLDKSLKKLKEAVEKEKNIDLIITSDHGMAQIIEDVRDEFINVFNISKIQFINFGAVVTMYPACIMDKCEITPEEIVIMINNLKGKKFTAYLRKDIPKNYHYSHNDRIPPVIMIMDNGYVISNGVKKNKGDHGWPVEEFQNMSAIFIAIGPSFQKNISVEGLKNVDYYGLVCKILDIEKFCHPNNSSEEMINSILNKSTSQTNNILEIVLLTVLILIIIPIIFIVAIKFNWKNCKIFFKNKVSKNIQPI